MTFSFLPQRVAQIRDNISAAVARGGHGQKVTIVAVTKTHSYLAALAAWEAGIQDCGENRIQEALPKIAEVKEPVRWHLIGHLQRNKVRSLDHFTLIHSVDSARLANAIDRFGGQRGRPVDALIQVNTSGEDSKGGFTLEELRPEAERLAAMSGIRVLGAMTMAPFEAKEAVLRATFAGARKAREILAEAGHPAVELSMGMSGDYEVAIEEGATIVRLGTVLFGDRE